jgi:predicted DNA-binding transcriptional regulator AlpA
MTPLLLDIDDVAAALGIGRRKAYELRRRPDFPPAIVLSDRCVRYRSTDVAAFVDRLAAAPRPPPEPEQLRRGNARRREAVGGLDGGYQWPVRAGPRPAKGRAEQTSIEPASAAVSAATANVANKGAAGRNRAPSQQTHQEKHHGTK